MTSATRPDHIRTPHLRPIHPLPVQKDGKQFVALHDPAQLSKQTMVVQPQALQLLQLFRGEKDIDAIAALLKVPVEQVANMAEALDRIGLLWGPTFEKMERALKESMVARGAFPVGASGLVGKDTQAGKAQIDQWLAQSDDPDLEATAIGIVAPHLDYARGWPNYAAAYRCIEKTERPDRVVILGTNHFGLGDGVVLSELGFDSPFGRNPADGAIVGPLVERLGKGLTIDLLDHLREHSIQLHLPWIQHRWGDVPIVAALVPDPLTPPVKDDGERVRPDVFADALRETLAEAGGSTFFIASADLSHVGPQFGEPRAVDDQRKHDVELHDREMMTKFLTGDAEEFLGAMKWSNNPTRWCSIGNMSVLLQVARPQGVELIDYRQACDERGAALVSSAAMALV